MSATRYFILLLLIYKNTLMCWYLHEHDQHSITLLDVTGVDI